MDVKVALLFPGQGSQYIGMGKSLWEQYTEVRKIYEEASEAIGFNLKALCFEGSMDELTKTENTQPAILTASVAAYSVYMKEIGIEPAFCAGHSLGELSALACAGVIDFSDAVKIVRQRGRFMQEAVPVGVGAMAAVSGSSIESIEKVCKEVSTDKEIVVISNYNSLKQIVISGHKNEVEKASQILKDLKAKVVPLKVSAPFHSPLMQPAADKLKDELKRYKFGAFRVPVISNVTAKPYSGTEKVIDNLSNQVVKAVRWQESIEYMKEQGITVALELGPKNVLKNLMKDIEGIKFFSSDDKGDMDKFKEAVGKISSSEKVNLITRCLAAAVCTKNHNWDNDEYQKGVVEPYNKLKAMDEEISRENRQPSIEEMLTSLELLRTIFQTKRVSMEEQKSRFIQILDETGNNGISLSFEI